jgi:hypothetical protein
MRVLPRLIQDRRETDPSAASSAPGKLNLDIVLSRTPNPAFKPLEVLAGKERLGKKWMDEQRIDNCKVPIDKRGTKRRPSTCSQVPTG